MSEKLNFAIDGEFLTNIARDWFWNMNKSYKKCEELLLSCMAGGSEEEKRHVCQDIIEGRKKLVGINEFELVDDNGKVLISCTSAAGLRFGILRWATRSSIWTRLIPQPKHR